MKKKKPIDEARRYVSNARKTLSENGELDMELQRYNDPKYVRSAGNYLWFGVLMALDTIVDVRKDRRTCPDINAYKEALSRRDKKLLTMVNSGYDVMHLYMNYDGIQAKGVCDEGVPLGKRHHRPLLHDDKRLLTKKAAVTSRLFNFHSYKLYAYFFITCLLTTPLSVTMRSV